MNAKQNNCYNSIVIVQLCRQLWVKEAVKLKYEPGMPTVKKIGHAMPMSTQHETNPVTEVPMTMIGYKGILDQLCNFRWESWIQY